MEWTIKNNLIYKLFFFFIIEVFERLEATFFFELSYISLSNFESKKKTKPDKHTTMNHHLK